MTLAFHVECPHESFVDCLFALFAGSGGGCVGYKMRILLVEDDLLLGDGVSRPEARPASRWTGSKTTCRRALGAGSSGL